MINSPLVKKLIRLALEEDLSLGDITSALTIPEAAVCKAQVIAKEDLVVCGMDLPPLIFQEMGGLAETESMYEEGEEVSSGSVLMRMEGNARDILGAERTIINFLQRTCGVATYTRKFVRLSNGLTVLDTRKTIPGWRILDKYSVVIGGARNHRLTLGDMVMVKNNHIDAAEGADVLEKMRNCLDAVFEEKPFYMPVEIEVRSLEELKVALTYEPTCIMLDNFPLDRIADAVKLVNQTAPGVIVEVSGGVTDDKLRAIHAQGIKCVSSGSLTTRARSLDISLRVDAIS